MTTTDTDFKTQSAQNGGATLVSVKESGQGKGVHLALVGDKTVYLSRHEAARMALALLQITHGVEKINIDGVTRLVVQK